VVCPGLPTCHTPPPGIRQLTCETHFLNKSQIRDLEVSHQGLYVFVQCTEVVSLLSLNDYKVKVRFHFIKVTKAEIHQG
jgi:hypothetical protein